MDSAPVMPNEVLEVARRAQVEQREREMSTILKTRKRKLEELYAVVAHVECGKEFPSVARWGLVELGSEMEEFLTECDLESGYYFKEEKLPKRNEAGRAPMPVPSTPPPQAGKEVRLPKLAEMAKEAEKIPEVQRQLLPERKVSRSPSPMVLAKTNGIVMAAGSPTPPPTAGLTNGAVTPEEDKENAPPTPAATIESTSTPTANQTPAKAPSKPPPQQVSSSSPAPDERAPIMNVDGVPVIQEATTRIPDEREKAAGVKPPPPPSPKTSFATDECAREETPKPAPISDEIQDVEMEEVPDSQPSPQPINNAVEEIPSQKAPAPKAPTPQPPAISQTKLRTPTPPPLPTSSETLPSSGKFRPPKTQEPILPAVPGQLQQIPPHAPLTISTDTTNRPTVKPPQLPLPTENPADGETPTSPTSTVDINTRQSTPGHIISSATSPDASIRHQLPANGLAEEYAVESSIERQARRVEIQKPGVAAKGGKEHDEEKARESEVLPSKIAEKEIRKEETEGVDMVPLATIPDSQDDEDEDEDTIVLQPVVPISKAPIPAPQKVTPIPQSSSPVPEPISPDPSKQLQLEHQLANGTTPESKPKPNAPEKLAVVNKPIVRVTDIPVPPVQQQRPLVDHGESDEDDDEDEADAVQLVGSTEPASRIPSPTMKSVVVKVPKDTPSAIEGKAGSKREPTPVPEDTAIVEKPTPPVSEVKEPTPPPTVEKEPTPEPERDESSGIAVPVERSSPDTEMPDVDETSVPAAPAPIAENPAEKQQTPERDETVEREVEPPVEDNSVADAARGIVERPEDIDVSKVLDQQRSALKLVEPSTPVRSRDATEEAVEQPEADVEMVELEPEPKEPSLHPPRLHRPPPPPELHLSQIIVSSAKYAAASAEAERKRLQLDAEQQGPIVLARRRTQAATTASARGRSSLFPPGSKMDILTRFGVEDPPPPAPEDQKRHDVFESYYQIKSLPATADDLIKKCSKAITTEYHNVHYFDSQTIRILQRVSELQDQGLWSLRQMQRAKEPARKMVHWDYLLGEMKWIREDFRGERRWKIGVAKQLVDWVMEWHSVEPQQRMETGIVVDRKQVGVVPKGLRSQDAEMTDVSGEGRHRTPELVEGASTPEDEGGESYFVKQEPTDDVLVRIDEAEESGVEEDFKHLDGPPPAALFTLSAKDTVFYLPPSKPGQHVLDQLPLFAPPPPPMSGRPEVVVEVPPIVATSKYARGRVELAEDIKEPPRKKSRYEYEINEEPYADYSADEGDGYGTPTMIRDPSQRPIPLAPEQNTVALFKPEFKSTLNRVRNHIMRPPQDMPPGPFFEHRTPSLWTAEEDEKIRQLAKEYNHNWALISTFMQLDGEFHSGAERRSPWECFERWIGLGEAPQEFQKSPYHKSVQQRLDIAAKYSTQYASALQNGQQVSQLKRKGTLPMRVERRRNTKQYMLFDAMRKLAKKRETVSKGQQSSRAAQQAARKAAEQSAAPASQQRTPQYFSTLKHEKEISQSAEARARIAMSIAAGSNRAAHLAAAGLPPNARLPNGTPLQNPNIPLPNRLPPSMAAAGIPQSSIPAHLRVPQHLGNQPRPQQQYSQSDLHALQLQRAQQQAQLQRAQALANGTAGTPQQPVRIPAGALKQLPAHADIVQALQQQNPLLTPEQLSVAAAKQLAQYHQQLALQMAARNPAMRATPNAASSTSPVTAAATPVAAGSGSPTPQPQPQPQKVTTPGGGNGGPTGVLIGANGPIGPGAGQMVEQERIRRERAAEEARVSHQNAIIQQASARKAMEMGVAVAGAAGPQNSPGSTIIVQAPGQVAGQGQGGGGKGQQGQKRPAESVSTTNAAPGV